MLSTPYDNENIYDLTIRLYGNINGLSDTIPKIESLDDAVDFPIEVAELVFSDYVAPETTAEETPAPVVILVGEGQSIYDLALQSTGNIQDFAKVLSYYDNLDDDLIGETISITRAEDPLIDIFLENGYIFSSKEIRINPDWLLATGVWDDNGSWLDSETWID